MHRRKGGVLSYRNLEVRSSWPKVCTCVEAVAFPFFDLLSPTVNRHNVETGPTRVALVCTPCAVTRWPIAAVAWKPDEVENFGRAATAPTRNAVEIPLLRRRGATHLSAQRRRRRCDAPCAKSFADALHCSRGHGVAAVAVCDTSAAKCGMLHEHSRQDWSAQRGQNYRVSTVHFERQWSGRVP